MATLSQSRIFTEEELMALPKDSGKWELVNGELTLMAPAGFDHGDIIGTLFVLLGFHVRKNRLGRILDGQTGFWMKSGNLFSPDLSFVSRARLAGLKRGSTGFFKGSPDLAVEVLSPTESKAAANKKIREYFKNDTRLAWLIDPSKKSIFVHHSPVADAVLHIGDVLDGESIVPGFSMPAADLFAEFDI